MTTTQLGRHRAASDPNAPNGDIGAIGAIAADSTVDAVDAATVWQVTVWTETLVHTIGQQLAAVGDCAPGHPDPGNVCAARRFLDVLRAAGYAVVPDYAVAVELVVTDDLAARLGVSPASVTELYRRGLLPPAVGRVGPDRHVWRAHLINALLDRIGEHQDHAQAAADAAARRLDAQRRTRSATPAPPSPARAMTTQRPHPDTPGGSRASGQPHHGQGAVGHRAAAGA